MTKDQLRLYTPLVRKIAWQVCLSLPPNVEHDDLVQEGMLGLMNALCDYDPTLGVFRTYANWRIKGAILDSLRAADWATRTDRKNFNNVERISIRLDQELGHAATTGELASKLGIALIDYHELMRKTCVDLSLTSVGRDGFAIEYDLPDPAAGPLRWLEEKRAAEIAECAIARLSARDQQAMTLYYMDGHSMLAVGEIMGITESRVSQLLARTRATVRKALA